MLEFCADLTTSAFRFIHPVQFGWDPGKQIRKTVKYPILTSRAIGNSLCLPKKIPISPIVIASVIVKVGILRLNFSQKSCLLVKLPADIKELNHLFVLKTITSLII
jgi:hypothetical protein